MISFGCLQLPTMCLLLFALHAQLTFAVSSCQRPAPAPAAYNSTEHALTVFFERNNGSTLWSRTARRNWANSSVNFCCWQGVGCQAGAVFSLSLTKQTLDEIVLVHELVDVRTLNFVDLSSNALQSVVVQGPLSVVALFLRDNLLRSVPNLTKASDLEVLLLSANKLDSLNLSRLPATRLVSLDVSDNNIAELDASLCVRLRRLQQLSLSGNALRSFPFAHCRNYSSLQRLSLSDNRLVSLAGVGNFNGLSSVDASGNAIESLREQDLRQLTRLASLALAINRLHALPRALCNLTALNVLDLSNNRVAALPDCIGDLTALETLQLAGNLLTELPDSFLCNALQLETLDISSNGLRQMPQSFLSLPAASVVRLNLAQNNIESLVFGDGFAHLQVLDVSSNVPLHKVSFNSSMNALSVLRAQNTSLSLTRDNWAALLQNAPNLLLLNLAHVAALDFAAVDFCANPCRLRVLNVEQNSIDALPDSLRCCAGMVTALFGGNALRALPPWLASWQNLTALSAGNQLTSDSVDVLQSLTLDVLDLSNNAISFCPEFLWNVSRSLSLANNTLRAIDSSQLYFGSNAFVDISDNEIDLLPLVHTETSNGSMQSVTLQTLDARNNRLSGRLGFLPINTLSVGGNAGLKVEGDKLNPKPLQFNSGNDAFQKLEADAPPVFFGADLACDSLYRAEQVLPVELNGKVTGSTWHLLQRSLVDLEPAYFAYRHCRCRHGWFGVVDRNGQGCQECSSTFTPTRVANCDNGGAELTFQEGFMPVFAVSGNINVTDADELARLTTYGGNGARLIGFEKCSNPLVCNSNGAASVSRSADGSDALLAQQACATGYTGRLCAECDTANLFFENGAGRCDVCPSIDYAVSFAVLGAGLLVQLLSFVCFKRSWRRYWPLFNLMTLIGVVGVLFVADGGSMVFPEAYFLAITLSFLHFLAERRRRMNTGEAGRSTVKVGVFFMQTLSVVGRGVFPRTTRKVAQFSFAAPGRIGVSCFVAHFGKSKMLQFPVFNDLMVALAIPVLICVAVSLALIARRAYEKCVTAKSGYSPLVDSGDDDIGGNSNDDNDDDPLSSAYLSFVDRAVGPTLSNNADSRENEPLTQAISRTCVFVLHVAFFGALQLILGVFACEEDAHSGLLFMRKYPALVCSVGSERYRWLVGGALVGGMLFVVAFPFVCAVALWGQQKVLNKVRRETRSPLVSAVDEEQFATDLAAASETCSRDSWRAVLLGSWSPQQPFAEGFWLLRRALLATALAVLANRQDVVFCVCLVLLLALLVQRRVAMFSNRVDQALDNLSLFAVLLTFSYARAAESSAWSAPAVCLIALNGAVAILFVTAMTRYRGRLDSWCKAWL